MNSQQFQYHRRHGWSSPIQLDADVDLVLVFGDKRLVKADSHNQIINRSFPNAVIAVTPETTLFYQEFPLETNKSILRSATYRNPDEDRQQRAARYLAARIDRETVEEDIQLTIWSNESMESEAFEGFYLSNLEYGVRSHHDHLRKILPIYNSETAPKEEDLVSLNNEMANASGA